MESHPRMSNRSIENKVISKQVVECMGKGWWAREPSYLTWEMLERQEENAQVGDTFLARRDENEWDISLGDGSERVLKPGASRWQSHPWQEGTYRVIRIITEYGSARVDHPSKWYRYTVSYLEGEESPYPFQYDRYTEKRREMDEMMNRLNN